MYELMMFEVVFVLMLLLIGLVIGVISIALINWIHRPRERWRPKWPPPPRGTFRATGEIDEQSQKGLKAKWMVRS